MKRRRLLSLTLALLLAVSLLPMGAMADTIKDNSSEERVDTISLGDTMNNNNGYVETNEGTITNNNGDVFDNQGEITNNNGKVHDNTLTGTITNNNGDAFINKGKITNNNGKVYDNTPTGRITNNGTETGGLESGNVNSNKGKIENNYGHVRENEKTITDNKSGGVVNQNFRNGTIETNNGTVGKKDESGNVVSGSGNYGTIEKNYGTVYNNQKDGTVETNNKTIEENYGTVITNNENGTVETNYRKVLINQKGGTIETNKGTVEENNGTVETNYSTVKTNNGKITDNNWDVHTNGTNGTIETNDHHVNINNGRIITNNDSVTYNSGTIETNNGTVNTNSGTVETNAIDGVVKNPISVETGIVTNFGTVGNNDINGKTYFGLSWGDSVEKLTSIESFVEKDTQKNLDKIAQGVQRSGYKMTGYTAYYRDDGKDVKIDSTADYQMKAPTWLQILWEKIVSKSESHASESHASESHSDDDTATPVRTVTYPTKVAAENVKVGTIVQRKGMRFQVIEMDDGSILIATVGKLSQKDIEDMKAFLAKYFTAEQLEMLLGDPELLSDELVAKYFGGSLEHICFRAAKDIFAQ